MPLSFVNRTRYVLAAIAVSALSISGLVFDASASPPSPELIEQLREAGELDNLARRFADARAKGVNTPSKRSLELKTALQRMTQTDPQTPDTFRVLVILVDFSDNPAEGGGAFGDTSNFQHLLFSTDGDDGAYSMTEFYLENSYGSFFMDGRVAGWYRMPQTYAYYVDGNNGFNAYPRNAQRLAEDAIMAANSDMNYADFDNDGDGWIDGVFVVHAGPGAEQTGSPDMIWSHQWSLHQPLYLDGIWISDYTMEPEELQAQGLITIGVFAHEYGHFLGLPDLYDTDYSSSGIGDWSLMAGGSWNVGGRYPAFLDAWCKKELGFLNPTNVISNVQDVAIPGSYWEPVAYRLWANGAIGNQYFLIENRRKAGNDKGIDASGLLIMHIDESIGGNWDESHPLVAVEQADGLFNLENGDNQGDAGDVWSIATSDHFDDLTTPNTRRYNGTKTKTAVWGISSSDSIMYASFDISYSRPLFILQNGTFSDTAFGNGNGLVEEGETITFTFSVQNLWLEATNVTGTLSADNADIFFDVASVNLGTIAGEGGSGNNFAEPIVFTVPEDFVPCIDSFFLEVTSDNPYGEGVFGLQLTVGTARVLVVDDDHGDSHELAVTTSLFSRRQPYDVHDNSVLGSPSGTTLNAYDVVIWLTGDSRPAILSAADVAAMKTYMDGGGNLFLTGQSIVRQLSIDDPSFLSEYLRAGYVGDILYPFIEGVDGSEIGDGIIVRFDSWTNQTDPQTIGTVNGSSPEFELPVGGVTGLSYVGDYRLVLFSFGFEGISELYQAYGFVNTDTVLNRIMDFFAVDTGSLNPTVTSAGIVGESSYLNVIGHVPEFYWEVDDTTGTGGVEYETSVGTGPFCHNNADMWRPGVLSGADTAITYGGDPLQDGQAYVFRVRVSNGTSWSRWKELPFRMNSVSPPGTPLEPVGGEPVSTATPTLKVSSVPDSEGDALTCRFEVFDDSLLLTLVTTGSVSPGPGYFSWTVDESLIDEETYFWRSRAFDGYEYSGYSRTESFRIQFPNQAPDIFSLLLPEDGIALDTMSPIFVWETALDGDASDTVTYTLLLSDDPSFVSFQEVSGLTDTTAAPTFSLDSASIYYWRVVASDQEGASTVSAETFSFVTPSSGCCVGLRGNVNGDVNGEINILDLTYLVAYLFGGGSVPPCMEEANLDGDPEETVNVVDLTYLVDYLFGGGPAPAACP